MQGNKEYLTVVGAMTAAHAAGIIVGSSTEIKDTEQVVRVKVTLKVLNKHIPDYESLPPDLQFGYYDGVADNPKVGGKGAAANFPLEDAETSALGRALAKLGFVLDAMATADEMSLVDKKKSSGYEKPVIDKDKIKELYTAVKKSGVETKEAADAAATDLYGVPINKLTLEQVNEWIARLSVPF